MHHLSIDIETFSSNNLLESGVYKYVEADDFDILLLSYKIDNHPVVCIDLTCEKFPEVLLDMFFDKNTLKHAYNAPFEITCLNEYFKKNFIDKKLIVKQWECTMVRAAMMGLPLSLDKSSRVLGLTEKKDSRGTALIRYFCVPCKPTKANGGRLRNLPHHDPEKWKEFIEYCRQDVKVENAVYRKLAHYNVTYEERRVWLLDQKINQYGVTVDLDFVKKAIAINEINTREVTEELKRITKLKNPNSGQQLLKWINAIYGFMNAMPNLQKETIQLMIKDENCHPELKHVLELKQQISKSSIKKYYSITEIVTQDLKIRGIQQYYGANRTGRWSGRLLQLQNLAKNHLKDLGIAREIVHSDRLDIEWLRFMYTNVPDTLSQLIRTSLIAPEGYKLLISDLSAIEARVVAWLSGEEWRIKVFKTHGKIYEASGSEMFKVPIEQITKGSKLRDKAKIAELALGYQGSVGALLRMGALSMGMNEDELLPLVKTWRKTNPKIVKYWYELNKACIDCVKNYRVRKVGTIEFYRDSHYLYLTLPSGRKLVYVHPRIDQGDMGEYVSYMGLDQVTGQWTRIPTYGGKLCENITQAVSRDILANIMLRINDYGLRIIFHVHDEVVLEVPESESYIDVVNGIMSQEISWAKGLPLASESFETYYYKKD